MRHLSLTLAYKKLERVNTDYITMIFNVFLYSNCGILLSTQAPNINIHISHITIILIISFDFVLALSRVDPRWFCLGGGGEGRGNLV